MDFRPDLHQNPGRLALVMDLADRKVVVWALSQTMEAEMTSVAAWQMAMKNRPVTQSLMFHADRGAGVCLPGIQKATYRSASATEYEQKR